MKTVRHVEEHGWSVLRIVGGQFEFAYTVGLWHTFRRAEVVMFGLGGQGMQHWLNACVDRCRDAGWPASGEAFDGVLDGFLTQLRPVDPSWHDALFGTAWRFYQGTTVPFLQLVWPDSAGVWPWHDNATVSSRTRQAFAWLPVEEHPPGGWRLVGEMGHGFPFRGGPDQYALTTNAVLHGANTVARVVNHDGGFDVLDARGYEAEDLCLAFLGELVRGHPDMRSFADLSEDRAAIVGSDETWTTTPLSTSDRDASDLARERARQQAAPA
jgi:hypothetical protein